MQTRVALFGLCILLTSLSSASDTLHAKVQHINTNVPAGLATRAPSTKSQTIPFAFLGNRNEVLLRGTLRKREFHRRTPIQFDDVYLRSIDAVGKLSFILVFDWTSGGASSVNHVVIQLVEWRDGKLVVRQQLMGRSESETTGARYDSARQQLVARFTFDYAGECCPRQIETIVYKVSAEQFSRWSRKAESIATVNSP